MNYAYLKMLDVHNNNYKFYEIIENDKGEVSVNYGRIGASHVSHVDYGYSKTFAGLYNEKTRKGYVRDDTRVQTATASSVKGKSTSFNKVDYEPIEYSPVKDLVDEFLRKQRQIVEKNFNVKVEHITQKQIDDAKMYLDCLRSVRKMQENHPKTDYTDNFNDYLYKEDYMGKGTANCLLFCVDRKLGNVRDALLNNGVSAFRDLSATEWQRNLNGMDKIILREENLVNALEGEYNRYLKDQKVSNKTENNKKVKDTILSANGIEMGEITYKEEDRIIELLRYKNFQNMENVSRYNCSFKVTVDDTQGKFDKYCKDNKIKDTMFLWHGTLTSNIWSIMTNGLKILKNPANGRAFGDGLYFANKSQKSANYCSARENVNDKGQTSKNWNRGNDSHGYLLLYEVATGNVDNIGYGESRRSPKLGCNSVWYHADRQNGFRDDEIIVYSNDACTLKYIVKIDSDKHPRHYNLDPSKCSLENGAVSLSKDDKGEVYGLLEADRLSKSAKSYWDKKFNTNSSDVVKIYDDKIVINDKEVTAYANTGNAITSDDYKHLFREVKKNFFEKESEFEAFKNGTEKNINLDIEKDDLEEDIER